MWARVTQWEFLDEEGRAFFLPARMQWSLKEVHKHHCSQSFLNIYPIYFLNYKVPLAIKNKTRQTSPQWLLKYMASLGRFSASACMPGQHRPGHVFEVLRCIEMSTVHILSCLFQTQWMCSDRSMSFGFYYHESRSPQNLSRDLIIQFSSPRCSPKPRESLYL